MFVSTFQLDSGVIMPELWTAAATEIKERIGKQNYETWIKPISFVSRNKNEILLEVPNKFFREWLTEHYLVQMETILSSLAKQNMKVVFEVNEKSDGQLNREKTVKKDDKERERPQRNNNLVPKYTFQNFVVGASNQFAHAASKAVANQPGDHYNPLFIYGGVGLGKTHLVNAIGHKIQEKQPALKIGYLSSKTFIDNLIGSLRNDRMGEFKQRFRRVDVLILDDVQLLAGRERTQEEFFHTFNTLHELRRQIVLTSAKVPKDIPDLEERLRNRFEWGLIADIQPPDVETRVAILEKKADL